MASFTFIFCHLILNESAKPEKRRGRARGRERENEYEIRMGSGNLHFTFSLAEAGSTVSCCLSGHTSKVKHTTIDFLGKSGVFSFSTWHCVPECE